MARDEMPQMHVCQVFPTPERGLAWETYNLAIAAAVSGINRSTVLRAIKSGKIFATKSELGEWTIEPAELHRVYAPVAPATARPEASQPDATGHVAGLEAQVAALSEVAALLRTQLDEVRDDREEWRQQAAPSAPSNAVSVPTVAISSRRRWWRWRRAG